MIERPDPLAALVDASDGATRAERMHAAARGLRETSAYVRVMLCELSYAMTAPSDRSTIGRPSPGLWHEIRRADGTPYRSQHDYLRALWGAPYSRSALSARKRLGQGLADFPCEQRDWLRRQLAEIGLMKALAMAAVIVQARDPEPLGVWLSRAADPLIRPDHFRRWVAEASGETRPGRSNQPVEVCPACRRAWKPRGLAAAPRPVLPTAGDKAARQDALAALR